MAQLAKVMLYNLPMSTDSDTRSRRFPAFVRSSFVFVLLATFVCAARAVADHAPDWLVSRAAPEKTLMGISVDDDVDIASMKARFGTPTTIETDPRYPNEATYTWRQGELVVQVTTMFPSGTPEDQQSIYAVKVVASRPEPRARTSAGLHLGQTLRDLVNKYGCRYQTEWRPDMSSESLTVVVTFKNDTTLSVGFSDAGAIVSLHLVASQE